MCVCVCVFACVVACEKVKLIGIFLIITAQRPF